MANSDCEILDQDDWHRINTTQIILMLAFLTAMLSAVAFAFVMQEAETNIAQRDFDASLRSILAIGMKGDIAPHRITIAELASLDGAENAASGGLVLGEVFGTYEDAAHLVCLEWKGGKVETVLEAKDGRAKVDASQNAEAQDFCRQLIG